MDVESELQRQTAERVREYLEDLFEEVYRDPDTGDFYVSYGTTVLEIAVEEYGPEDSAVRVTSYCVQGVEVEEELLRGLLELNHRLPFGAFALVERDLFFTYTVFGSSLERRSLLGAIAAVANVADDYDDRIVAKYGGQTALQRMRDAGGRRRRRATS